MSNGDGSPSEILKKAEEEMLGKHPPVNAMIIGWYSTNEKGSITMRYLHWEIGGSDLTALLSDLAFENHILRRSIFGNTPDVYEVYPAESKDET